MFYTIVVNINTLLSKNVLSCRYLPLVGLALPLELDKIDPGLDGEHVLNERALIKHGHSPCSVVEPIYDDFPVYDFLPGYASEGQKASLKPVYEKEPQGQVFCFLPLPLEKKSPTGLRVHVHGSFAVDQNRRHLKYPTADQTQITDTDLLWNKFLMGVLLPKAFSHLIDYLVSLQSCQYLSDELRTQIGLNNQLIPSLVYSVIPEPKLVPHHWRLVVPGIAQEVRSVNCSPQEEAFEDKHKGLLFWRTVTNINYYNYYYAPHYAMVHICLQRWSLIAEALYMVYIRCIYKESANCNRCLPCKYP